MSAKNLASTTPIVGSLPAYPTRQSTDKRNQVRNPSFPADKTTDIFVPANNLTNTLSPPRRRRNTTVDSMPAVRQPSIDSLSPRSPISPRSSINLVYSRASPKSVKKFSTDSNVNTNEITNFNKDLVDNLDIDRLKDLYDKEEIPFVDLNYLTDNDYICRIDPAEKVPSRDPSLNILLKHNIPRVSINKREQMKFFIQVIYEAVTNTREESKFNNNSYFGNYEDEEGELNLPQMKCEMDIWLSTLNECVKIIGSRIKPVALVILAIQRELKKSFKQLYTALDNEQNTPSKTASQYKSLKESDQIQSSKSQIDIDLNDPNMNKTNVIGALKRDIQRLEDRITQYKVDLIAAQIEVKDKEKQCERLLNVNQQLRETITNQERKLAAMSDKSNEISASGLGSVPDAAQVVWGELSSFARDMTKALKKVNINLLLPESTAQLNQPKVGLNAPSTAATSFKAKAARRKSYASTVQNNLLFDFDIYSLANAGDSQASKDPLKMPMTTPGPSPPQRPTMVPPKSLASGGDSFPKVNAITPPNDAFPKANTGPTDAFPRAKPAVAFAPQGSSGGDAFPKANNAGPTDAFPKANNGSTDAFPRIGFPPANNNNSGGGDAFPKANTGSTDAFPRIGFPPANNNNSGGGGDAFPKANTGSTDAFPRIGFPPANNNSGGGDAFPKANNAGPTDAFPKANAGDATESFPRANNSGGDDAFPKANTGGGDAFPRANNARIAFPPANNNNSGGGDAFPKANTGPTDAFPKANTEPVDAFPKANTGAAESFPRAKPMISFPPTNNNAGDAFPKANTGPTDAFPKANAGPADSFPRAKPGVAFAPPGSSGGGGDSFPKVSQAVSFPQPTNSGGDTFPRINASPSLATKPSPSAMNVPLGKSASAPVQKRVRAPTRPNKKLHFTNFFPDMCNFTDTCSGALLSKPPTSIYTQLESELRQFLVQVFQKYKERMTGVRTEVEKMSDKFNNQLAHIKEGLGTRSLWARILFKSEDFISLPKDVKVTDDYQESTFSEIARAIIAKMRPQESEIFSKMLTYEGPNNASNQKSEETVSSEKVQQKQNESMSVRPTTASDVLFDVFPASLIEKMIDFIAYVNKTSKSDISVDMFRRFFSADLPFTHFIFFCKLYLFSLSLTAEDVDPQQLRVNALSQIFNRYGYSTTFPEDIRSSLEEQYCATLPSFIVLAMSLYAHIISKLSQHIESEMNSQKNSSPSSKKSGGSVNFRAHGTLGKQQFLLNYLKESVINYVEPEKPKPKNEEEEENLDEDEEAIERRKEEERKRKEEQEKARQKLMMSPEKEAENKNAVEYMKAIAGSAKDLSFVEVAVEMFNYVIPLENSLQDFDPQNEQLLVYLSTFGEKPKKGKKAKDKNKRVLEPIKPGDLLSSSK